MDNAIENKGKVHIAVNAQYIKDLSFESPESPESLVDKSTPKVELGLDVRVEPLGEEKESFEVSLKIQASAARESKTGESKTIFIIELVYAGVFTLENIPEEDQNAVLAIECTSMIFPFARKIIADTTQSGGFQPLMIDPINFAALYRKKILEQEPDNKVEQYN